MRLVQLAVSIGILVWIYTRVPLDEVIGTVRSADARWLATGTALVLLLQVLVVVRWRLLVRGSGSATAFATLVGIQFSSVFYKLFIPGGMIASIGVRFYKLQELGGSRAAALSSVVVDRLFATLGLAAVGTLAWIVDAPPAPPVVGWVIAGWLAAMLGLLVVVLHEGSTRVAHRLSTSRRFSVVTARVLRLSEAFALYRNLSTRDVLSLSFHTLLPHLAGFLAYWALARAVGVDISPLAWAWLRAAITLVTSQPVSIAGVGVRDVTVVWLLAFHGVEQGPALAVACLFLGVAVLVPAAAGAVLEARAMFAGRSSGRSRGPGHLREPHG